MGEGRSDDANDGRGSVKGEASLRKVALRASLPAPPLEAAMEGGVAESAAQPQAPIGRQALHPPPVPLMG